MLFTYRSALFSFRYLYIQAMLVNNNIRLRSIKRWSRKYLLHFEINPSLGLLLRYTEDILPSSRAFFLAELVEEYINFLS